MKRTLTSILFFILGFIISYLMISWLPAMRIKLAAEPMEYFLENIRHMAQFKGTVSLAVGLVLASIPLLRKSRK